MLHRSNAESEPVRPAIISSSHLFITLLRTVRRLVSIGTLVAIKWKLALVSQASWLMTVFKRLSSRVAWLKKSIMGQEERFLTRYTRKEAPWLVKRLEKNKRLNDQVKIPVTSANTRCFVFSRIFKIWQEPRKGSKLHVDRRRKFTFLKIHYDIL